jgi:hypothetical protein
MVKPEVAKRLLALHGTLRPQPPSDWSGPFPLPPDIEEYYREVGPSDISIRDHGNPYFLPRLAHLWRFQAGYRWDGISGEGVDDWSDNWFVVAAQGGDPFIYERTSGVVLHAFCGEGHWDPKEVFPISFRWPHVWPKSAQWWLRLESRICMKIAPFVPNFASLSQLDCRNCLAPK